MTPPDPPEKAEPRLTFCGKCGLPVEIHPTRRLDFWARISRWIQGERFYGDGYIVVGNARYGPSFRCRAEHRFRP